jgi:hypothetical protein
MVPSRGLRRSYLIVRVGTSLLRMHAAMDIMSRPPSLKAHGTPSEYKSLEGHLYQKPTAFISPDYRGLANVNPHAISSMITDAVLDPIIVRTGLAKVMRWKPMSVRISDSFLGICQC